MDKFMGGLADMINGQTPEDADVDTTDARQGQGQPQDMDGFRRGLISQTRYISVVLNFCQRA